MSILKSNNASTINDPIDFDWLKQTGVYQKIHAKPKHLFHTFIESDPTIWEAFQMYIQRRGYLRYGNNDLTVYSQWTKINNIVFQYREMTTKGDVLKFLGEVKKVINEHPEKQ